MREKERSIRQLFERRATVRDRVIDAQIGVSDSAERLSKLDDELAMLELQRLERSNERYLALLDQRLEIEETEREVERLSRRLEEREAVTSPYSGVVVELKVNPGEVLGAGAPIATVAPFDRGRAGEAAPPLRALLYVPPADGKQVEPGMTVEIAPTTVEREEFGFVRGEVLTVSPLPATLEGMRRVLQNEALVDQLSGSGAPFQALVELREDPGTPSGYAWSSSRGPDVQLGPGTLLEAKVVTREVRLLSLLFPGLERILGQPGRG
jgi:NHLM bacteriocin system secretion protein